jgi:hypothetical protein
VAQLNAAVNWPSKPIHAVVPLAPGTGGGGWRGDAQPARATARPVDRDREQSAGGTATRKSEAAEFHTLLAHSSTHVIAPSMARACLTTPPTNFSQRDAIGSVPSALVIAPSKGIKI